MTTIDGTVENVHMVSRITPEGSKLFCAEIIVKNPGSLTADMAASATTTVNGEVVYPYEAGKLEYYRTGDLCSTVSGTVISSDLVDYLQVSAGQVLVRIDGEDSESEIFTVEQSLEEAQKELETAQKNLDNCSAVAPIDGTVIGLALQEGMEVEANSAVITIADTGVGFYPEHYMDDGKTHIGIQNVRQRLEHMVGGTLEITSTPGVGTIATIIIPRKEDIKA